MKTVTLRDAATGNSASILIDLGFNCYEWTVQFADGPQDLLWAEDGFAAGDRRPSGSGIPLLFPFPGRIGHSQYSYEGRDYVLDHDPARPHALHGFVFNRPWKVIEQTDTKVVGEFHAAEVDPTILEHWPSDFTVVASYELVGNELRFEAEFANSGEGPLPWGFGTHAYLRLPMASGSATADTLLTAPLDREWPMVDMLPTGEQTKLAEDITFSGGLKLGERKFDTVYANAVEQGMVQTVVADPMSGRRVVQEYEASEYPVAVVYTPGDRQAVCIEPYTCVPDPFRLEKMGISTGLHVLKPGEKAATKVVLRAEE
ncbi:aldose 1-epimerase [Aeoliella mucimassa]|uniref:Aldose 1-epimerase n=1 Tax=Aeoliella mucimassa TaxID=2527972 RepID=A0A518AN58_9BACT|nr:aldose 1-epimerase [Aeoliella mucimassa]QDU56167.1 Aldose 1-epimerase [Aeoliella mucimassa]